MASLISVIIPNFNRQHLIIDSIRSVFDQTYRPIELIVVDDHSTDQSIEIIKSFFSNNKDSEISTTLLVNPRKGAQAARNVGIEVSRGSYLQFLDSDDLLLSHKLMKEVTLLESNSTVDLVYSKCQFFDENGTKDRFWGKPLEGTSDDYFEFSWQTMCALYRKSAIEKIGPWNEELTINQDWEFSIRAILKNLNVQFIDSVHSKIREHDFESIGKVSKDGFSFEKIQGKEKSLSVIYSELKTKGLMDQNLIHKIRRRYSFIMIQLGMLSKFQEQNRILEEKKELLTWPYQLFFKIKSNHLYRLIWKTYLKIR